MSNPDIKEVEQTLQQYLSLKEQIDLLSERQSELKKRLNDATEAYGEVDSKGHIVFEFGDARLVKQRKVSNPINEEVAMRILTEKDLLDECAPKIRKLDQDAIMAAVYKGFLTESDIDEMLPPKISYAFIIKG
jgi:hypothetical protein